MRPELSVNPRRNHLIDAATRAPKQREPKEVVSARRSALEVGLRGTFGCMKYQEATVPATVVWITALISCAAWSHVARCGGRRNANEKRHRDSSYNQRTLPRAIEQY